MNKLIGLVFVFVLSLNLNARDVIYTQQDSVVYNRFVEQLNASANVPVDSLLVKTALYFKDTPYVASTLEDNDTEQLVVNLREFDCTTFVESCIALSRMLKTGDYSFSNFCDQLLKVRYRDGEIEDYVSRLHYMTDWVDNNIAKGILTDESNSLHGVIDTKTINFMSNHVNAYKPLQDSPEVRQKLKEVENRLNKRDGYYYVKKSSLKRIEDKIRDGDIIIFATSIHGLDYSHIGIAYHDGDRLTFVHASTKHKKVIIEPQSLFDYCMRSPKCTGITVLRLNGFK